MIPPKQSQPNKNYILLQHKVRKTLEIRNKFSVILHLIKGLLLLYFENKQANK